jgi:hypothetical protein
VFRSREFEYQESASEKLWKRSGIHCKKKLSIFPSLTKLSLAGNNLLFPDMQSLVRDIPAGDRKISNLFYSVLYIIRLIKTHFSRFFWVKKLNFYLLHGVDCTFLGRDWYGGAGRTGRP